MGVGALWVFFVEAMELRAAVLESAPVVTFNSGVMKLFGIGLAASAFTGYAIAEIRLGRPPSAKMAKSVTSTIIAGLALLFLLPHLVHTPLERHLFSEGYKLCEPLSHRWLSYKTIVYVNDVPTCINSVKN